jgi:Mce-associated membrane protein
VSAAAEEEAAEKEAAEKEAAEGERPEPDVDGDADVDAAAEPVAAAPAVTKKTISAWFSRHKKSAAAAAVAAFVIAGGLAGAAVQPYLMERAAVTTKLTIARTAADAITALWSYTPEDMDSLPNRSAKYLGGDLEGQYRAYVDAIAPTNKQAKVTSSTQVVGVGVESLRGDDATALVYTNTTSTTPQSNNIPSMKYLSYRLEMHRDGNDWRVTKMTTVTSLDLTPKLGM